MTLFTKLYYKTILPLFTNDDDIPNVDGWKAYIDRLPESKDCLTEAHNKYICKKYYLSKKQYLIFNLISEMLLLPAKILCSLPSLKTENNPSKGTLYLERKTHIDYNDTIPDELLSEYDTIKIGSNSQVLFRRLDDEAKRYLREIKRRYPKEKYFIFVVYKELARHCDIIRKINPVVTVMYAYEKNFASPIITEYYEKQRRKFISFMHGDYLLQLIQAYMHFSEYYVWDKAYIEMYTNELRCNREQFKVYTPRKLYPTMNFEGIEPEYDCTYYFSGPSEQSIHVLSGVFKQLRDAGLKCKIRLHPRWTINEKFIREEFSDFYIEDSKTVSLSESLGNTKNVIGLSSTVLHEAFINGKRIILDDLSSPEHFNSLKERKYIMLTKDHGLLSDYLSYCKNTSCCL